MIKYIFICLLFISVPVFAADTDTTSWLSFITDFIDWVKSIFNDIDTFFTVSLPALLTRFTAWGIEYYVVLKLKAMYSMTLFAYGVAQQISEDLHLSQYLSSAVSGLPSDLKYLLNSWGIFNAINFVINCFITRFVLNILGW